MVDVPKYIPLLPMFQRIQHTGISHILLDISLRFFKNVFDVIVNDTFHLI